MLQTVNILQKEDGFTSEETSSSTLHFRQRGLASAKAFTSFDDRTEEQERYVEISRLRPQRKLDFNYGMPDLQQSKLRKMASEMVKII